MEDTYRLIDYGINVNDVVQLMVRAAPVPEPAAAKDDGEASEASEEGEAASEKKSAGEEDEEKEAQCEYYEVVLLLNHSLLSLDLILVFFFFQVGDLIDAKDPFTSSWVEARIVKITNTGPDTPLQYHVLFQK